MNKNREEVTLKLEEVTCVVCNAEMIWTDTTREWICPKCGNRAFQDESCAPDEIYYEYGPVDYVKRLQDDRTDVQDAFT